MSQTCHWFQIYHIGMRAHSLQTIPNKCERFQPEDKLGVFCLSCSRFTWNDDGLAHLQDLHVTVGLVRWQTEKRERQKGLSLRLRAFYLHEKLWCWPVRLHWWWSTRRRPHPLTNSIDMRRKGAQGTTMVHLNGLRWVQLGDVIVGIHSNQDVGHVCLKQGKE